MAAHTAVFEQFPVISEALLNSASPQVRNQATMGGNLLQRTRCPYFRDVGYVACNKRAPGSGCAAIGGEIVGTPCSGPAITASPPIPPTWRSRLSPSTLRSRCAARRDSARSHARRFHRLPGDTPHIETALEPGEVITAITGAADRGARRSRLPQGARPRLDSSSPLVSAAVALDMDGARIRQARVALGGVGDQALATSQVEAALAGSTLEPAALRPASAALASPRARRVAEPNDFKIELMQRAIVQRRQKTAGARP